MVSYRRLLDDQAMAALEGVPLEAAYALEASALHDAIDADMIAVEKPMEWAEGAARYADVAVLTADRSGVDLLDPLDGMLFWFPEDVAGQEFTMRGAVIPLDIAFSSASGELVSVETMPLCEADPVPPMAPTRAFASPSKPREEPSQVSRRSHPGAPGRFPLTSCPTDRCQRPCRSIAHPANDETGRARRTGMRNRVSERPVNRGDRAVGDTVRAATFPSAQ